MNRYDFEGRRAAVTGGASGIGRAIVDRLLSEGAAVEVWDLRPEGVPDTTAREVDVTEWDSVKAAADAAEEAGGLDILVCSAGIAGPNATTWNYPLDAWAQVMRVNVDGVFHCCRAVVPGMLAKGYGRIVNIASIAGKEGNPNAMPYSAAKAGVIGLTKAIAKEVATRGVYVNCVTPAVIETPILEQVSEEHVRYMVSRIPMGRTGKPEEVAALISWLCSEECSFSTGAVFDISGGRATY